MSIFKRKVYIAGSPDEAWHDGGVPTRGLPATEADQPGLQVAIVVIECRPIGEQYSPIDDVIIFNRPIKGKDLVENTLTTITTTFKNKMLLEQH